MYWLGLNIKKNHKITRKVIQSGVTVTQKIVKASSFEELY
jgi:hypothetical protein